MENVTIELIEKPLQPPYFLVQAQKEIRTIQCFCVMKDDDFESTKQEAIAYANTLRSMEWSEKRTLIEF